MIRPWTKVSSRPVGDFRIFTIRSDEKVSPVTGETHDFYVIDCVDWVNVVPVTTDGQVVMIEQYRHGSNTIELEIPGGMMDSDDDSPVTAGLRELREETGYEGTRAQIIGTVFPNPAIMSNTCHTLLVEDCVLKHPVEFDIHEDLITRLVPIGEVASLIARGTIRHSLVVAALYHLELWRASRR